MVCQVSNGWHIGCETLADFQRRRLLVSMLSCLPVQVAAFVDGAGSGLVLVGFGTSFQFNSWLSLSDYQGGCLTPAWLHDAAAPESLRPVETCVHALLP